MAHASARARRNAPFPPAPSLEPVRPSESATWLTLPPLPPPRSPPSPSPAKQGTDLLSVFHLPFVAPGFASRPYAPRWYMWPLLPLALPFVLLVQVSGWSSEKVGKGVRGRPQSPFVVGVVGERGRGAHFPFMRMLPSFHPSPTQYLGTTFVADKTRLGELRMATWVVPRLGFQYFFKARSKDAPRSLLSRRLRPRVKKLPVLNPRPAPPLPPTFLRSLVCALPRRTTATSTASSSGPSCRPTRAA